MRNTITLLDGAMGTMLQKQGLKLGHLPELLCLEQPQHPGFQSRCHAYSFFPVLIR